MISFDSNFFYECARHYEIGFSDAIAKAKDIVKNYHAHIDDETIECILKDLEHLKNAYVGGGEKSD